MNPGYTTHRLAVAAALVATLSGIVAAHVDTGPASLAAGPQAPALSSAYADLPRLPEIVVTAPRAGD